MTKIDLINIQTVRQGTEFTNVAIVSLITKIPQLRTLALLIGTKSHVHTRYIRYYPSAKHPQLLTAPVEIQGDRKLISVNNYIDHLLCAEQNTTFYGEKNQNLLINSRCFMILNGYIMKSFLFTAKALKQEEQGSESSQPSYSLVPPEFQELAEYEIPKFYKTISVKESPDYLAVHGRNTVDHHQEIFVFKKGRKQVWTSTYTSAGMETTYAIAKWHDGTTWMYVNEIGSELKVYLIGNMTLEVKEGYDKTEQLRMLYSTFGRPSEVVDYTEEFRFSENLVRKSNILLVIYGSFGGFFGVIFIFWCCYCCIWRCVHLGLKKIFKKKKRRIVPILVKKLKKKEKIKND